MMRWLIVLVLTAVLSSVQADEGREIKGADYDPALDGDGTYRGFPSEFEGRYPKGMPPGEGWKVLSGDGWLATSKCIGSFESPECMMDTVLACELWSNVHEHKEHREGEHVRRGKWHPICGKLELDTDDPFNLFHWRRVFYSGRAYPKHWVTYYKTKRFTVTATTAKGRLGMLDEATCKQFDYCPGDVILVLLRLDCLPDTKKVPGGSADAWHHDYSNDTPLSYCERHTLELALISRKSSEDESWQFLGLFNSGDRGSGYTGWPYLEKVYQSMR